MKINNIAAQNIASAYRVAFSRGETGDAAERFVNSLQRSAAEPDYYGFCYRLWRTEPNPAAPHVSWRACVQTTPAGLLVPTNETQAQLLERLGYTGDVKITLRKT